MGPFNIPLERYVSHFLNSVPFPSLERPRILVQLSSLDTISLYQPQELPLQRNGANFRQLLLTLGPENCLMLLLLALTEQKILVHSLRSDIVTMVSNNQSEHSVLIVTQSEHSNSDKFFIIPGV